MTVTEHGTNEQDGSNQEVRMPGAIDVMSILEKAYNRIDDMIVEMEENQNLSGKAILELVRSNYLNSITQVILHLENRSGGL